jgi:hypothetical protein
MKLLSGQALFFSLFLPALFFAQAPLDTAYIYMYGGKRNETCHQIRTTADKGYILLGTTNSFGHGNTSFYAVKTDFNCRPQWTKVFGGPQNQAGYSVTQTSDKGYAFLGYTDSYGQGGYDAYLIRTDSLGNTLWEKTYGGADWDFGYSIKQTRDEGFIFCGQTYSFGSGSGDVYLVKTDKNGDTLWTRALGGTGCEVGNSLVIQGDTLYTIAGATTSFGRADTSILFMQVDTNGVLKNLKTFGCSHSNAAYSIAPTADKGYILMGSMDSATTGIRESVLIKTDKRGNLIWMNTPGAAAYQDIGKDAIQGPDHSLLCVGAANGGGYGSSSMHITHLDSAGNYLAWPSFGGNASQYGNSVTCGAQGNVLFAGESSSYGSGNLDMYLVRFLNDSIDQNYTLVITSYADTTLPFTSIADTPGKKPGVRVFPNPMVSSAEVLIQDETRETYLFRLFDVNGKCILEKQGAKTGNHGQSNIHIDREGICSGIYSYEIMGTGIRIASGRLVIE